MAPKQHGVHKLQTKYLTMSVIAVQPPVEQEKSGKLMVQNICISCFDAYMQTFDLVVYPSLRCIMYHNVLVATHI